MSLQLLPERLDPGYFHERQRAIRNLRNKCFTGFVRRILAVSLEHWQEITIVTKLRRGLDLGRRGRIAPALKKQ
jgi:hypothetical protein